MRNPGCSPPLRQRRQRRVGWGTKDCQLWNTCLLGDFTHPPSALVTRRGAWVTAGFPSRAPEEKIVAAGRAKGIVEAAVRAYVARFWRGVRTDVARSEEGQDRGV